MHWTLKPQGYWGHFFEAAECPQTMLKSVIDESGGCAVQQKLRAAVKLISQDTLLLVIALFYRAFQTLYLDTVKQLEGEILPRLTQHRLLVMLMFPSETWENTKTAKLYYCDLGPLKPWVCHQWLRWKVLCPPLLVINIVPIAAIHLYFSLAII